MKEKTFSYEKELLMRRDLAFEREQKRYEKIQRAIEKKDAKALDKWLSAYAKGKDEWLD